VPEIGAGSSQGWYPKKNSYENYHFVNVDLHIPDKMKPATPEKEWQVSSREIYQ